jgi:hypothetical protein
MGIIQDHAIALHIKLRECIARDTAGSGRLNMYEWHTVGG